MFLLEQLLKLEQLIVVEQALVEGVELEQLPVEDLLLVIEAPRLAL